MYNNKSSCKLVYVFIIYLLGMLALSYGQTCEPQIHSVCPVVGEVGTPIYVPPGWTLSELEEKARKYISIINFQGIYPEPCRSYYLALVCLTYVRPCLIVDNTTIPVPKQPCVDLCWAHYNTCAPIQIENGETPGTGLFFPPGYDRNLNCSMPMIDAGAYNSTFYSPPYQIISVNSTNYTVPCSPQNFTDIPIPAPIECRRPLEEAKDGTICAFECPVNSLTDEQYLAAKRMQAIMGWISWTTSALLFLMLIVVPKARAFPRCLILMTAVAANIAAGAISLPSYAGYDYTWCDGSDSRVFPESTVTYNPYTDDYDIYFTVNDTSLLFSNPLCTFQGAMLQFGFLAAVFWWVIIAFNMCFELYLGPWIKDLQDSAWKWPRIVVYNIIGWGLPFLCMVIPAAAGKIKFSPAATYCFVSAEDDNAWSLTFWYLPVGISLLSGVTLFLLALLKVTILFTSIKKVKNLLMLYLRLFIFIFVYLVLFVFIFAYYIQYASNKNQINSGYEEYFTCLISADDSDDCQLGDSVTNYDLVMLKGWAISALGFLLFCVFISWDVLKYWWQLFIALFTLFRGGLDKEDFRAFKHLIYPSSTMSIRTDKSLEMSTTIPDDGHGTQPGTTEDNEDEDEAEDEEEEITSSSSTEN